MFEIGSTRRILKIIFGWPGTLTQLCQLAHRAPAANRCSGEKAAEAARE
jgi:hypothetical protein